MSGSGIIDVIKPFFKNTNSVLEIGCYTGNQLFPFIEFGFKEILGLDLNAENRNWNFVAYLHYRNNYSSIIQSQNGKTFDLNSRVLNVANLKKHFKQEYLAFCKAYKFQYGKVDGNIMNFEFPKEKFDVIIVSKLLHFFPPKIVDDLTDKIANSLSKDGIFYCANNHKNKMLLDKEFLTIEILENEVVKATSKGRDGNIWYLFDDGLIKRMKSKFSDELLFNPNEGKYSYETVLKK